MFSLKDGFVVNERGTVVSVDPALGNENSKIMMETKNGKVHQRWRIVYVDEYEKEPTKGQSNKRFGLYVDRDFYILSKLPSKRYLDLINNRNLVIKTKTGLTAKWYFHQPTRTIRSRARGQAWDIKNSGKTNDMQIWSTN
jgi:hypothetical protein